MTEANQYREHIRADLADERAAHDRASCPDCSVGRPCLDLHYSLLADEIVENQIGRRKAGGPS